jgi:CRISPR-associated protein Cas2
MLTWLVYDISSDRTRDRVAQRCLDFGLYRVQKSVYLGDLPANRLEEVLLMSRELLDPQTDSLYAFPMCKADFARVCVVGQGFDKALVADELGTAVL